MNIKLTSGLTAVAVKMYRIKGEVLRAIREEKGLSQRQLADRLSEELGVTIEQQRISEREASAWFTVSDEELILMNRIFTEKKEDRPLIVVAKKIPQC